MPSLKGGPPGALQGEDRSVDIHEYGAMHELDESGAPSPLTTGRLKAVALRQWGIVVACGLFAAVGAAVYAEIRPLHYVSSVTVLTGWLPLTGSASGGTSAATSPPDPIAEAQSGQVLDAAASAAKLSSSEVGLRSAIGGGGSQLILSATAPTSPQARQAAMGAARAFVALRIRDINAQTGSFTPELRALRRELLSLDAQVQTSGSRGPGGGTTETSVPNPLSTEISVVTSQYSTLYAQWLQLQGAGESVRIEDGASPSSVVDMSGKGELVAIALGSGLIAGCGIALVRDFARDRLSDATEVPELSRLPLLAELPASRLARKRTVPEAFGGQLGETVRELRTSLTLNLARPPLKVLLIASAATGEGRSFVAANLAVAWARSGARTVLVSSDLRRPSVERLLGARVTGAGLPQLLSDWVTERDGVGPHRPPDDSPPDLVQPGRMAGHERERLLQPTAVDGLTLVPSGPMTANPAELLGSPAMAEMVGWLRERADIVILDSPPLLAVTDALVLSSHADGVLLVVTSGRSSKGNVQRALRLLERSPTQVLGFVVNRATRSGLGSYPHFGAERRLNGRKPAHHMVPVT